MDRTKKSLALIGVAVALLAMTAVTASPLVSSTPLYTLRMEKASSKMNFSPTPANGFTYATEKGYVCNFDIARGMGISSAPSTEYYTCEGDTCEQGCVPTGVFSCIWTCDTSCWITIIATYCETC